MEPKSNYPISYQGKLTQLAIHKVDSSGISNVTLEFNNSVLYPEVPVALPYNVKIGNNYILYRVDEPASGILSSSTRKYYILVAN